MIFLTLTGVELLIEPKIRPSAAVLATLFALWTYLGLAITRTGSAFGYLLDVQHILLSVLVLLGAWLVILAVVTLSFRLLDHAAATDRGLSEPPRPLVSLAVFALILVCWMPYLIVCFPGYINFDYFNQLNQFVGSKPLSNHHPVFMTFLLGGLYELGHILGGARGGLYLTVLVQALCLDGLFCYLHRWLCRMGAKRSVRIVVVAICALCPILPLYACVLVKDTLSAVTVGLFALLIAGRAWCDHEDVKPPRTASLPVIVAVGMLCSLTRANCVYLVLGVLIACLFCLGHTRKAALLASMAAIVLAYMSWTNLLLPAAGVIPSDTALVIRIPLQQTGAFARDAADETTPEERAAIENLLGTPYEQVAELYTPNTVDPLQAAAHDNADSQEKLHAYMGAWISQGLKRPDVYLDALLHANVGYWYPAIPYEQLQDLDYTQNTPASHLEAMRPLGYEFSGSLSDMDSAVAPFTDERAFFQRQLVRVSSVPVVGLILQPAFYTWANLIVGIWSATRQRSNVPLLVLTVLLFLVECVSPLAASMRYALPLVVLLPVVLGTSLADRPQARHTRTSRHHVAKTKE